MPAQTARIGTDPRSQSNQDRSAVEGILIEEFTATIRERADRGLAWLAAFAVGEI
jgi:hypothetical protein